MCKGCRAQKLIRLHKSGMQDCQDGLLDQAVEKLTNALDLAREIGIECYQAKILNNMGIVLELNQNKNEARKHYQQAHSILLNKLGPKASLSSRVAGNLKRVSD